MTETIEEQRSIKEMSIGKLMRIRSHFYPKLCSCGLHGCYEDVRETPEVYDNGVFRVTQDEVYAELATREHYPNKIERKAARQEKAKQRKSSNKGRKNR